MTVMTILKCVLFGVHFMEELAPNKVTIKEHGVEQNIDVDIELEKIEL